MDYITAFDIRLDKDVYYGGENISGGVVLENSENIRIRNIRVLLRGKAHTQLKMNKSGERRILKDDQYILDEKAVVWGQEKWEENENSPVLPRGMHQFPFQFMLPQCSMPCSLETKFGTIRYYIKVIIDIPYASSPQGIKYFTIIGPPTDCMDEKYRCALLGQDKKVTSYGCCRRGALALRIILDRTAYLCGENVRILAHVENRQDAEVWVAFRLLQTVELNTGYERSGMSFYWSTTEYLKQPLPATVYLKNTPSSLITHVISPGITKLKFAQHVEYFVEKNAAENKHIACVVLESKTPPVRPQTQGKFDTAQLQSFVLPVVPPTLIGVCRLLQIFYVFRACIEDEKGNQVLHMEFPLTIATMPFRKTALPPPVLDYDYCSTHVEGGRYISPEFRIGHIYDGQELEELSEEDDIVLYRPLYVRLAEQQNSSAVQTPRFGREIRKSASVLSGSISLMTVPETERLGKESTQAIDDSSFDKTDSQKPLLSVNC